MKIKLKKKTRKQLRKLGKTARRVSAALAADVITELADALVHRSSGMADRLEQRLRATPPTRHTDEDRRLDHPVDDRAHGRDAEDDRAEEHRLPRTADHN